VHNNIFFFFLVLFNIPPEFDFRIALIVPYLNGGILCGTKVGIYDVTTLQYKTRNFAAYIIQGVGKMN
jgi:hypothetical protein